MVALVPRSDQAGVALAWAAKRQAAVRPRTVAWRLAREAKAAYAIGLCALVLIALYKRVEERGVR